MPAEQNTEPNWEVLDERVVRDLVARKGASTLISGLISDQPTPRARAEELNEAAIAGKLSGLKEKTDIFKTWAEDHGLRRLSNALVELDRVLDLPERGQAILHAQALTRFIARHVDEDVEALRQSITGNGA